MTDNLHLWRNASTAARNIAADRQPRTRGRGSIDAADISGEPVWFGAKQAAKPFDLAVP